MKSTYPKAPETIKKIEIEQLLHLESKIHELTRERKRVVTLIGGYGPGYDVVDPLVDGERICQGLYTFTLKQMAKFHSHADKNHRARLI
ncbi:MAG: hypothetical protein LLG04_16495 [Parachlamydia sp.]|nr:hypothetical protein [Parachlamydia sp.]